VTSGVRIDRFGLLDPFMVVFALAAMAAVWASSRRRSWAWLCVSAVCLGLSMTSKVPSAVLLPAILVLPALVRPAPRALRVIGSGCLYLTIVAVVVALVYLPVGLVDSLQEMVRFQLAHREAGHLVAVAGVVSTHPSWWADLLFAVEGTGVPVCILLACGALAAFLPGRAARARLLPGFLAAAVLSFWVFQFLVSGVALPHYYYDWIWLFCALFGVGLARLIGMATRAGPAAPRRIARAAAAASVAVALVSAGWTTVAIAGERPRDMALVLPALDHLGVHGGGILVAGLADWEYTPYLDGRQVTAAGTPGVVAVAVKDSVRFPVDAAVRALLADPAMHYRRLELDDVTLFVDETALSAAAESPP
jgi:hypothetical protein